MPELICKDCGFDKALCRCDKPSVLSELLACQLRKCKSGLPGTVRVNDNIGDGSWLIYICKPCADKLGLRDGDDLK